jgi:hypothetical protein
LESVALAFITVVSIAVVSIAVASTVEQPWDVGWRLASELPQWEQLPLELTELIAAVTIPIDRATKPLQGRAGTSVRLFPLQLGPLDRQIQRRVVGAKK